MSGEVIEASHRFPRCALVLQMSAIALAFRTAAIELEELAGAAPHWEIGTLRRKARAIVLGVIASAEGGTAEGES